MKKIALILAMTVISVAGVSAQDTINFDVPPSNYFYNKWITDHLTGYLPQFDIGPAIIGKYCYTDTALTIYGIATVLNIRPDVGSASSSIYEVTIDTSRKNTFEKAAIYNPPCDTSDRLVRISEEKVIHIFDSTPAYYLHMDIDSDPDEPGYESGGTQPLYEVYFNEPVEVTDSFYVGVTYTSLFEQRTINGQIYNYDVLPIHQFRISMDATYEPYRNSNYDDMLISQHEDSFWGTEYRRVWGWLLTFPILTPKEVDTTGNGTVDTTGNGTVDTLNLSEVLLDQYVKVQPNPATERVQVVSSFGLRGVEVYDTKGAKVMEQQMEGLSAHFDVTALPEGAYILKIRTPSGIATKKLIVQRK